MDSVFTDEEFTAQHPGLAKMSREEKIQNLIQRNNLTPSLFYWRTILTYFERNSSFLTTAEVRQLCSESERCRLFWKEEKNLYIRREEVFPDIYTHLARLERSEKESIQTETFDFSRHVLST